MRGFTHLALHSDKVAILLDTEALASSLPEVFTGPRMLVIAAHMASHQPSHISA